MPNLSATPGHPSSLGMPEADCDPVTADSPSQADITAAGVLAFLFSPTCCPGAAWVGNRTRN